MNPPAYQQPLEQVLAAFGTDARRGLSQADAGARLEHYGPNELTKERPLPAWKKFLAQFRDALVVLLIIATAISLALWLYERDTTLPFEAIVIFVVVILNAVMGYVQESRAESAVAALSKLAATRTEVTRDGEQRTVLTSEIVPGDIIIVEEGNAVPADARVIQSIALQTAEAALTGESLPVSKETGPILGDVALGDRDNMIFGSTVVTYGRGRAVVVATGMQTELGRIAGILRAVEHDVTPLQNELDRVGKALGFGVVVIAAVMIATIVLVENVRTLPAILDVLIVGVALAVAAVPEGLPGLVTAVLSIGVRRMARRNAIVRHLGAVETLGSADVIASDKTGTLTKNEMTVRTVVTASGRVALDGAGYAPDGDVSVEYGGVIEPALRAELSRLLAVADRANNAVLSEHDGGWTVRGDPTEGALVVAARKAGVDATVLASRFRRVAEVPFSSERKLMSTVHTDGEQADRLLVFTKGAPEVLLPQCTQELVATEARALTEARRREILKDNDELADRALRTMGIAYRELPADALATSELDARVERDLVFAGLVGMIDPPRDEAEGAVAQAKRAGIRPILITGDHPRTAGVIAMDLGIARDGRTVSGVELQAMSDDELMTTIRHVSVYARVNPEHKLRIVEALQRQGAIVAMTGDGVNDAPALKRADIGIAMGISGTDVSKQVADMILTDDNFASIVAAVEEGRAIFSNIRKFLRYLLSSNIGEVITMFLGVLLIDVLGLRSEGDGVVLPLLATQLLWINLVTDGAPALALGVDPTSPESMKRRPRSKNGGVITRRMWFGIFFVGAIMAVGTLLVLDSSLPGGLVDGSGTARYAQTMAFTTLVLFQLFNVFNARSDQASAFRGLFTNGWLWGAVSVSLLLHAAVVYTPWLQQAFSTTPLSGTDWLLCTLVASSVLWLSELRKVIAGLLKRQR